MTDDVVARLRAAGCVFAEDEAALLLEAADSGRELEPMVARREAGEPLEHILGCADFAGLRIGVGPGVFVPRHRSELLAEVAAGALPAGGVLVELCCGSAAISLRIATLVPDVEVHAADIDPAAVAIASANLAGIRGSTAVGDLFEALPSGLRGRVDVLVANAPYVPSDEVALLPRDAREHEPRHTLDGGADGLDLHRRIAARAREWLRPGGALAMECSEQQAPVVAGIFAAAGLVPHVHVDDERESTAVLGRA